MSQYVHPEFGFFCPSPGLRRWRRLLFAAVAVGGIAVGVMATGRDSDADSAAAVAAADTRTAAETTLPVTFTPVATVASRSSAAAAQAAADKPSCLGDSASADGKCALEKPRKPRMVRVGNRPAIASIPLGRTTAPLLGAHETSTPAAGRQADTSKTAQATTADAATAGATGQAQKPAATTKKKTAHNRKRDQNGYGRDVRVADWWSRSYSYGYGYSRGGYGRSFW